MKGFRRFQDHFHFFKWIDIFFEPLIDKQDSDQIKQRVDIYARMSITKKIIDRKNAKIHY